MNCHAGSEALERYAISGLPEEELEEHLLVCGACREEFVETETYVEAMRSAARELRNKQRRRGRMVRVAGAAPGLLWAVALAVLLVGIFAGSQWLTGRATHLPPLAIALEASRGTESTLAPAGRSLVLSLDLTQLPEYPTYRVEVVSATGQRQAQQELTPAARTLEVPLTAYRKSGAYFVRLYSPQQELLREYALEIQ